MTAIHVALRKAEIRLKTAIPAQWHGDISNVINAICDQHAPSITAGEVVLGSLMAVAAFQSAIGAHIIWRESRERNANQGREK